MLVVAGLAANSDFIVWIQITGPDHLHCDAPYLEVFKAKLDDASNNLIE